MRKLLIFAFVFVFMTSLSTCFAAGLEVTMPASAVAYTTETTSVDIVVKNTQSQSDTFTLSLFPTQFEKISANLDTFLLTLAPGEEKTVKLVFVSPIDAEPGSTIFEVITKSTSDESVSETKNIILTVQRITSIYIPELSLEKYTLNPSEPVKITATVYNLEDVLSEKTFLKIAVKKGTEIVQTFDESLDSIGAKSSVTISKSFVLDQYAPPGSYAVESELRDATNQLKYSKAVNFQVNTVTQPPTEYSKKSTGYNVIFSLASIKIKNEGNVELPSFTVTQSLPRFAQSLFDPEIEPTSSETEGTRVIYNWVVPPLQPGGQYTISYKIALWRVWISLIILGGIVYGGYKLLSKPRIGKRTSHQGEISRGKEILIMLDAKNRAFHEIKDVEIVDVVPTIARVVDRFDTLRPKAKRVPGGTELRWSFGSMRPGEERVVTYRIRPVVDVVGHLSLPHAQMIFTDRHKVKRLSISKQALIKAA